VNSLKKKNGNDFFGGKVSSCKKLKETEWLLLHSGGTLAKKKRNRRDTKWHWLHHWFTKDVDYDIGSWADSKFCFLWRIILHHTARPRPFMYNPCLSAGAWWSRYFSTKIGWKAIVGWRQFTKAVSYR
jgi:hypothetical protein